jgi:hypothetical protein
MQAKNRGLKEVVLSGRHGRGRLAAGRDRLLPLISRLLRRAQASGDLRADIRATDIPILVDMVTHVADVTRDVVPDVHRRYVAIVLDGLRVTRPGPGKLEPRGLTTEELEAVRRADQASHGAGSSGVPAERA